MPSKTAEAPRSFWVASAEARMQPLEDVHPLSSQADIDSARQTLDHELLAIHCAISAAKTRRNTMAPISRLPPEMMSHIFHLHALDEVPAKSRRIRFENPYAVLGWITVTHVCRAWRQMALDDAFLWSDLVDISPKWMLEMFERCRDAPFGIAASFCRRGREDVQMMSKVVQEILARGGTARLRSLKLDVGESSKGIGPIFEKLQTSAPLLESCVIKVEGSHIREQIPKNLFEAKAPRLRRLILNHWFVVPWRSSFVSNLVQLEIVQSFSGGRALSVAELLRVLSRTPRLETLVLQNAVNERETPTDSTIAKEKVVELQRLSKFTFRTSAYAFALLMSGAQVLPSCHLLLECKGKAQDLRMLSPVLGPFSGPFDKTPLHWIKFESAAHHRETSFQFTAFTSTSSSASPKLQLRFHSHEKECLTLVPHLFSVMHLEHVSIFEVYGFDFRRWKKADFQAVFAPLAAVSEIRLHGINSSEILELLMKAAPRAKATKKTRGARAADQPAFFPALAHLAITNVGLRDEPEDEGSSGGDEQPYHLLLCATLDARRAFGAPVGVLALAQCRPTESVLAELEARVPDVRVEQTEPPPWQYGMGTGYALSSWNVGDIDLLSSSDASDEFIGSSVDGNIAAM